MIFLGIFIPIKRDKMIYFCLFTKSFDSLDGKRTPPINSHKLKILYYLNFKQCDIFLNTIYIIIQISKNVSVMLEKLCESNVDCFKTPPVN